MMQLDSLKTDSLYYAEEGIKIYNASNTGDGSVDWLIALSFVVVIWFLGKMYDVEN